MHFRILVLLLYAAASMSAQAKFSLDGIVVPRPVPGPTAFIEVSTSGTAPATNLLEDPGNWQVYASETENSVIPLLSFTPKLITATGKVRITFDLAQFGGHDPRSFGWNVIFKGVVPNLTASRVKPKKQQVLSAAKGKDDAVNGGPPSRS